MNGEFLQQLEQQWPHYVKSITNQDWLVQLRQQHYNQFREKGLPTSKDEKWKYTNLAKLSAQPFNLVTTKLVSEKNVDHFFLSDDHYRLVLVDGVFQAELSLLPSQQDTLIISNLAQAIERYPDKLQSYLMQQGNHSTFSSLNFACINEGIFVNIPQDCKLDKPLHLLFINTTDTSNHLHNFRTVIVAQPYSQVDIIEEHVSQGQDAYIANIMVQLYVEESANVDYIKIQNQAVTSFHVASTDVIQKKDSHVKMHWVSLGSELSREEIHCHMNEAGAQLTLNGLYLPLHSQHMDVHTYVYHNADHTISEEIFKGIAAHKCSAVFNGKIIVEKNIKGVVANLQNKNLLLAKDCEVNTKPELEIYSQDVKCRHGATIGQIDENMLFYLRSRGISHELAQELLLVAFINENLNAISNDKVANRIKKLVANFSQELSL